VQLINSFISLPVLRTPIPTEPWIRTIMRTLFYGRPISIHSCRQIIILLTAVILIGCATPARNDAENQCKADAYRQHPPLIERMTVNKTRAVRVPTGDVDCSTYGTGQYSTTTCKAKTKIDYIPYIAIENVDKNEPLRNLYLKSCADSICLQNLGNKDCK
jgi:hypothetical protein